MTTDLLETLRALAPVVTPGEWKRYDDDVVSKSDDALIASVYPGGYTRNGLTDRNRMRANATAIVTLRNALPAIIAALEIAELVRSVPQILPAAKLDEVAASAVDWDGSDIPENEPAKWETEAGVIRDMVAEIRAYRAIIAALPKETDNAHD